MTFFLFGILAAAQIIPPDKSGVYLTILGISIGALALSWAIVTWWLARHPKLDVTMHAGVPSGFGVRVLYSRGDVPILIERVTLWYVDGCSQTLSFRAGECPILSHNTLEKVFDFRQGIRSPNGYIFSGAVVLTNGGRQFYTHPFPTEFKKKITNRRFLEMVDTLRFQKRVMTWRFWISKSRRYKIILIFWVVLAFVLFLYTILPPFPLDFLLR
jgi:hypothetical protein